ncbi:MAG TPA: tetraacyldisaccharide 4'-kinase [Pseudolabrys sp.]
MRDPAFWWRDGSLAAALLAPFAAGYGAISARRMAQSGTRAGVPVVCVGNFTLGGAGKTPTVLMLTKMLQEAGEKPCCLSRGYGGSEAGPRRVDVQSDTAEQVGDEPLLLARAAHTIVSRDRVAGAKAATGSSVIVMDDGLQNGALAKDFTIAVIDGRRGIGNGKVFPAGPLRAPLDAQMARTDALLVIGGNLNAGKVTAAAGGRPVFHGRLAPDAAALTALKSRNVFAFAGIGDPEKFFDTLTQAGIAVTQRKAFADHHRFTGEEAAELEMQAEHEGLTLVTTEKDHARMSGDPALAALAARAQVLPVTLVVDEVEKLRALVLGKIRRA